MPVRRYTSIATIAFCVLVAPLSGTAQELTVLDGEEDELAVPDEGATQELSANTHELTVLGGGEIELTFPDEGTTRELSAYLEAEQNGLYGGVLALVAADAADSEVDLYFGFRGETENGFRYDLNYTRYFFPNDGGDCCGEVILSLGQAVGDSFGVSTELKLDPETSLGSASLGVEYAASDKLTLSANFGVVQVAEEPNEREWDLGVTYGLNEETALDLRYYDGSDFSGYLGVALTFDTTLLGG